MNHLTESLTTIALAIVGVAILAVLVSRNANTSGVIQSAASGFGNSLLAAEAPVTGSAGTANLSYPGSSDSMGLYALTANIPTGL